MYAFWGISKEIIVLFSKVKVPYLHKSNVTPWRSMAFFVFLSFLIPQSKLRWENGVALYVLQVAVGVSLCANRHGRISNAEAHLTISLPLAHGHT